MRYVLVIIIVFAYQGLNAQTNFGLGIGFDNTKFSGDKPDGLTYEFKRSYSVSAFIDFQIADKVQLSVRPGYARGGANIGIKDTVGLNEDDPFIFPIEDSYFNLSALFKIYNKDKVYALAGPELAYLLTSESEINNQKVDLSEQLNELAFGMNIGFGLNFNMFKQPWAAEWQLNQMLTTLTEQDDIEQGIAPKLRTTRTRLMLIYKFKRP